MARRLMRGGHEVVTYDLSAQAMSALEKEGARGVRSVEEIPKALAGGTAICWVMLPSGSATEEMVQRLSSLLKKNDILLDGGNSHFKDDIRRSALLEARGIRYLDVGTSGGVWGLERGYSLMIGGDRTAARELDALFKTLAPGAQTASLTAGRHPAGGASSNADEGYLYCGPAGAGHFVKMVHNGIEYGMMQSLAEGFDILRGAVAQADYDYDLDLREISEVWRRGSVVSSWLLDLIAIALNQDPKLASFGGHVPDSGEGRWTVQAALEEGVPAQVISAALYTRFRSREEESFAEKLLSAMRKEFGGHAEADKKKIAS